MQAVSPNYSKRFYCVLTDSDEQPAGAVRAQRGTVAEGNNTGGVRGRASARPHVSASYKRS